MKPISNVPFPPSDRAKKFLDASSGQIAESEISWLKQLVSSGDLLSAESQLLRVLEQAGLKVVATSEFESRDLNRKRAQLLVVASLVQSTEEAEQSIRDVSLEISNLRIREKSSKPDLQAMESVQALDEVDKTANILSSRVREWYGLHFPELTSMIDDNVSLVKLVLAFERRENYDADEIERLGYSKNKSKAIETAAKESRGADLRDEDTARILQIAEESQRLYSLRDRLATHVEKTMRQVAPNLTDVAGASIGARLIARAGGLEKLAILPASTIQILGAEKALYRALKSGSRPPKHGILFQHPDVHGAPKWQRGKIARSVAGKTAIAARIDVFRGSRDESVLKSLHSRLEEIRLKYKDAPKEKSRDQARFGKFSSARGEGRREEQRSYGKQRRGERQKGYQRK